jgi:hypothetical protein
MMPFDERARVRQSYLRQVRRQVYLPLVLGVLGVVALVVLAGTARVAATGTWANVALVLLLMPALLIGVVVLGAAVGAAYLVTRLIQILPEPAARVRLYWHRYIRMAERGADLAVEPILKGHALWNGAAATVRQLRAMLKLLLGGRDGD